MGYDSLIFQQKKNIFTQRKGIEEFDVYKLCIKNKKGSNTIIVEPLSQLLASIIIIIVIP